MVEQEAFERRDFSLALDRVGHHPRNLPHVNLSIGDDVRTGRSKMPGYPAADSVGGLTNIDGHLVQIAKDVNANLIGQGPHCLPAKSKIDSQKRLTS